ncbi:MAG: response regulator [Deltaproteobacteria bacterium]|nr:response regulator [Deltaproteobacteria bacterium]
MSVDRQSILIIDDEPRACQSLAYILNEEGYVPFSVNSGKEAIEAIADRFFNLALIDLKLPDIPGIKVLVKIKELSPDTEAVIITGHASLDTAVQAMQDGAFGYVTKPIDMDYLLAIITRALEKQKSKIERKEAEEELRKSREELRNLSAYLQSATEQERTSIAREIHDDLGQALTALKMDLSWLGKRLPGDQKSLIDKTESMSKLIDATIQTVQRLSARLRPGLLDDLGLTAAIEWQVKEFENRTGTKCELTRSRDDFPQDRDLCTAVFRIFQETLTNVARHANATNVKITLKEELDKLVLEVTDNGKGITENQISDPKSFGLIGIRERARFFNGEVKISGMQDKGSTVRVSIPAGEGQK